MVEESEYQKKVPSFFWMDMSPCLQQKTCKRKKGFFKFFPFTVHVQKSVGGNTLATYHITLLHTYKNQSMNKMREGGKNPTEFFS